MVKTETRNPEPETVSARDVLAHKLRSLAGEKEGETPPYYTQTDDLISALTKAGYVIVPNDLMQQIAIKAAAGLCQFKAPGKHEFLRDISLAVEAHGWDVLGDVKETGPDNQKG